MKFVWIWLAVLLGFTMGCNGPQKEVTVHFKTARPSHAAAPTSWDNHSCYFLSVSAPDLPELSPRRKCMGVGRASSLQTESTLYQEGITFRVPTGFERTFRLFGVQSGDCEGKKFSEILSEGTAEVRLLGERRVSSLFRSRSIKIENSYSVAQPDRMVACANVTEDGGGGAPLLAFTAEGGVALGFSLAPFALGLDLNSVLTSLPIPLIDGDPEPLSACAPVTVQADRRFAQILFHYELPDSASDGDLINVSVTAFGSVRSPSCGGSVLGSGFQFSLRNLGEGPIGSWGGVESASTPSVPATASRSYTLDRAKQVAKVNGKNLILVAVRGDSSALGTNTATYPVVQVTGIQVTTTP